MQIAYENQPGLDKDVAALQLPPKGLGRKILRPKELEGLPQEIRTEALTGDIRLDFEMFKEVNPQYINTPEVAWAWFKNIKERVGEPIEDSDWTGDPEEIGQQISQPEKTLSKRTPGTQKPGAGAVTVGKTEAPRPPRKQEQPVLERLLRQGWTEGASEER